MNPVLFVAIIFIALLFLGGIFIPELRQYIVKKLRIGRTHNKQITSKHHRTKQQSAINWQKHWPIICFCICLIMIPPLLAIAYVTDKGLDLFAFRQKTQVDENSVISVLLAGEQLVPPPSLPPQLFDELVFQIEADVVEQKKIAATNPSAPGAAYTNLVSADLIVAKQSMIKDASRNWGLFDKEFRQRLLIVFKLMKERHGYEMVLLEGYRSPERQSQLYAKGGHVTRASANRSFHQYGLAADCAFLKNGKIVVSERDPWAMDGYKLYGQVAQEVGLTWGGSWKKIMDLGHVELHRKGVLGSTPNIDKGNLEEESI